jgi:hypothetical protein
MSPRLIYWNLHFEQIIDLIGFELKRLDLPRNNSKRPNERMVRGGDCSSMGWCRRYGGRKCCERKNSLYLWVLWSLPAINAGVWRCFDGVATNVRPETRWKWSNGGSASCVHHCRQKLHLLLQLGDFTSQPFSRILTLNSIITNRLLLVLLNPGSLLQSISKRVHLSHEALSDPMQRTWSLE